MTISRLLASFWPVFGRILRNSATVQVQVEGGLALTPGKQSVRFRVFMGFDPKSSFWVKNCDGRRFILVVKVPSKRSFKRHASPCRDSGFRVVFVRKLHFGRSQQQLLSWSPEVDLWGVSGGLSLSTEGICDSAAAFKP